jgi:hypothetical protein
MVRLVVEVVVDMALPELVELVLQDKGMLVVQEMLGVLKVVVCIKVEVAEVLVV